MRRLCTLALPLLAVGLLPITTRAEFLSSTGTGLAGATQTITNGDKTFSNFTCAIVVDQVASPTDCSQIAVSGSSDAAGNLGLLFQSAFNTLSTEAFGAGFVDILIGYTVTAPAPLITDLHMVFNGNVTGTGSTNVTEQVMAGGTVVGQITVQNPPTTLEASADLTGGPYTTLDVTKDIGLSSGPAGTANFSFVGQYFSQVPEPASLMLFGTLLGGVGLLRKRVRKA